MKKYDSEDEQKAPNWVSGEAGMHGIDFADKNEIFKVNCCNSASPHRFNRDFAIARHELIVYETEK